MSDDYNRWVDYGKVYDDRTYTHVPDENDPKYRRSPAEVLMSKGDVTGAETFALFAGVVSLAVLGYSLWRTRVAHS